jgi:hypothetical protein
VGIVLPFAAAQCNVTVPTHQWTFNDGTAKDTGSAANAASTGLLAGNATITNGQLVLDSSGAYNTTGDYMNASLADTIKYKTLVAWVTLPNLDQRGSVLTVGQLGAGFDAVEYGMAQVPRQWVSAKSGANASPNNTGAAETSLSEVAIAVTYEDNLITIYRNGQWYANQTGDAVQTFNGGNFAYIGYHHPGCEEQSPMGPHFCFITVHINEARIYNSALSACQIAQLTPGTNFTTNPNPPPAKSGAQLPSLVLIIPSLLISLLGFN